MSSKKGDRTPARDPGAQYESIQEFVTVGIFGFLRVRGPFNAEKEGTLWTISIPTNEDDYGCPISPTLSQLRESKGQGAVVIADGEAVGGGIIAAVAEPEGEEEMHVVIDQYAMGGS